MKHRKFLIITLIMALLMMTVPVAAQDGGEEAPDPIELIFAANSNLLAAEYFTFTANQSQTQNIISGLGRRQSTITRTTDLTISNGQLQIDASGTPVQVALTVAQTDEQQVNEDSRSTPELSMNSEFRYVDGQLYVRVTRIGGGINETAIAAADQDIRGQLGSNFLTGWVNVTDNPEQLINDLDYLNTDEAQVNLFDFLNIDALVGLGGGLNFSSAAAILNVATLPSEDADVFIYSVQLDPEVMLANLDIIRLVDTDDMAGDVDLLLQELFAGLNITQVITIEMDGETPLLVGVDTTLAADVTFSDGTQPVADPPNATGGVSLRLVLETVSSVEYGGIGREFELAVPAPEIQVATTCDEASLEGRFTITNRGANMTEAVPYTISQEGTQDTQGELQLEAGTRRVETRRDGTFTLTIPAFNIQNTLTCETPEESTPTEDAPTNEGEPQT